MPPRTASGVKGGQEAGGQPTTAVADKELLSSASKAYNKHMNQHQFLISRIAKHAWEDPSVSGQRSEEEEFDGFDVSLRVDEQQHEKAFLSILLKESVNSHLIKPLVEVRDSSNSLSVPLMQQEDSILQSEVSDILAKLKLPLGNIFKATSDGHKLTTSDGHKLTTSDGHKLTTSDGHKLTTSDGHKLLAQLALKLINAELMRKIDRSSGPVQGGGKTITAAFKSRVMIDNLIRKVLSASDPPNCFSFTLEEGTKGSDLRAFNYRCAISRGRQLVRCQGAKNAILILKTLSENNAPEVKVVIQLPHDDERDLFPPPPPPPAAAPSDPPPSDTPPKLTHPTAFNIESDSLVLDFALSFDLKGRIVEPKRTVNVCSTSPLDGSFYTELGAVMEEVAASWDSVRVLVTKGREGKGGEAGEGGEDKGRLRALGLIIRVLSDLKALGRMGCAVVRRCTDEQEREGGLVQIILAECDLKRNKWGLALKVTPAVLAQQRRAAAGSQRPKVGGDGSASGAFDDSMDKLESIRDTYDQLLKDLGGQDWLFGKGMTKALHDKITFLNRI